MRHFLALFVWTLLLVTNESLSQGSPWLAQNTGLGATTPVSEVRFDAVSNTVCWGIHAVNSNRYVRTTDGGEHWTVGVIPGAPSTWRCAGIEALDANTAWILMRDASGATSGGVFKTTNAGTSWTQQVTAFPGSGGNPRLIHFFDANVGLCVGFPNGGNWEIYRTTNGGELWSQVSHSAIPPPLSGEITFYLKSTSGNSFWFSSSDVGLTTWGLYRTTDRGVTWTRRNPGGVVTFGSFRDSLNGIAGRFVPSLHLLRTSDGGDTWIQDNSSPPPFRGFLSYVPGTAQAYVLAGFLTSGGGDPGSAYSTDAGTSWTVVDNTRQYGLASFASPTAGWCAGDSGVAYKWIGTQLEPPNSHWLTQHTGLPAVTGSPEVFVNAVNTDVCWVLESQNSMYSKTTNGGVTWNASAIGGAVGLRGSGIIAIDASTAWAAMNDPSSVTSGGIFKTTNGGVGWNRQTAFEGQGGFPNLVHFFDANSGVCVGDPRNGYWEIYTTTNGGTDWTRVSSLRIPAPLSGEEGILDGYRSVGNYIWFVTNLSSLYRSTNRGNDWTVARNVSSTPGFGFGFKDSLNGLSIGNPFARTTDGGVTWVPFVPDTFPSNFSRQFLGVVPRRDAWIIASSVAGSSGTAYTTNNGNTWRVVDNALHGRTRFVSNSVGWSAGVNDVIYKWNSNLFVTSVRQTNEVAQGFRLEQNYPNPFNPSTKIAFSIPVGTGHAPSLLKVYDVLGREVRTLVNENLQAGNYEVTFDATGLASGVYFYRLQAGELVRTKKLMLLR